MQNTPHYQEGPEDHHGVDLEAQHRKPVAGAAAAVTPSLADKHPSSRESLSQISEPTVGPGSSRGSTAANTPPAQEESYNLDTITKLHERDDGEIWKGWKRGLYFLNPFVLFASICLYFAYLSYRIACVVWAQRKYNTTMPTPWIFVAVEIVVSFPTLLNNSWTMWSMKSRHRPKLRVVGDDCPRVDVLITCCGEDDSLILDTTRAAADLDYPQDRFRVVLLDDGKSASLQMAVEQLAQTYPNVYYLSRPKYPGVPHHFKSGNLNYGINHMHLLPGGAAPFVAGLDADMIPEREWLRALMPHLMLDPNMAMACAPQLFYNTPASDPLGQTLNLFVHVTEPIKDALGVAWCGGSGYVARRTALDSVDNFALDSLAEDVFTSTRMLAKGWNMSYVHEPLQFGTVPEDFSSHLKQRTRWAIGTVDFSFKFNFFLFGECVRQMTFAQRVSGFIHAIMHLHSILFNLTLLTIPIMFALGKVMVGYATEDQLRLLIRLGFASTMCTRLSEMIISAPSGYNVYQRSARYGIWMAPFIAVSLARAFILPSWLGGEAQAFKATGSLRSTLNERDPKLRAGLFRRLYTIIFGFMSWFHLLFVTATIGTAIYAAYHSTTSVSGVRDTLLSLITHAFWPPLHFLFVCTSFWVPISYAINPPSVPDREDLLERDPKTGVAHPTAESKKIALGGQAVWFEFEYMFRTVYIILVFAYSFIF